jgi:two-component system cell cycle response regulator
MPRSGGATKRRSRPGPWLPRAFDRAAGERLKFRDGATDASSVATVLIIDDSATLRELTRAALHRGGMFDTYLTANDGFAGFRSLLSDKPDLVICDLNMPGASGRTFLELRRAHPKLLRVPVILLTSDGDEGHKADLLEAGASDYVVRPFHPRELIARVRVHLRLKQVQEELAVANERLLALSRTDALTGLLNRRALDESMAVEVARALRYGSPLSIAVLDVDHFKRVNDTYGHTVGDDVLRAVARTVLDGLRKTDIAARFGGEEMVVVMPHTDLSGAAEVADRLRVAVRATEHWVGAQSFAVTASFGVAGMSLPDTTEGPRSSEELFSLADASLYAAKREGRDRVVVSGLPRFDSKRPNPPTRPLSA